MPGVPGQLGAPLIYEGAFDEATRLALDDSNDWIVYVNQSGIPGTVRLASQLNFPGSGQVMGFGSLGTAITVFPANTFPAGTYIASVYAVCTTALSGGSVSGFAFPIGYSDDQGARTPTIATVSAVSAGTVCQGNYTFRALSSAAINFTPNYLTGAPTAGAIAFTFLLQRVA
jgi:hypothetical protein